MTVNETAVTPDTVALGDQLAVSAMRFGGMMLTPVTAGHRCDIGTDNRCPDSAPSPAAANSVRTNRDNTPVFQHGQVYLGP